MKCKQLILMCLFQFYMYTFYAQGCQTNGLPNKKCANDELFNTLHTGNSCDHWLLGEANHCEVSKQRTYDANTSASYSENQVEYDFTTINFASQNFSDWFLVWNDEFNYGKLDDSFWRIGLHYGNSTAAGKYVYTSDNVVLEYGKMKLTAKYNNDPNYLVGYCGAPPINAPNNPYCSSGHFDYTSGGVSTLLYFPIESRFQTVNKLYPNPKRTFPALWLLASEDGTNQWNDDRYQEIDIYEVTDANYWDKDDAFPEQNLKLTYHSTKYGYLGRRRDEAIFHNTGIDLTNSFNQYDLIWDKYKIQWWFNSQIINEANRYYYIPKNWSSNKQSKSFRTHPIHNYTDLSSKLGERFAVNNYFPKNYPMYLIFNVQLENGSNDSDHSLIPAAVGTGKSQEMEYLKIWIRKNCNFSPIISQNNYVKNDNVNASIIEAGFNLTTNVGSNVILTGNSPQTHAIYSALNEIGLNDGFSVDEGANFFGFISECEAAWEQRPLNAEVFDSLNSNEEIIEEQQIESIRNDFYHKNDVIIKNNEYSFLVECTTGKLTKVELYDSKASLVLFSNQINSSVYDIVKDRFSKGIYTLKSFTETYVDIRKLIIN